MKVKTSVIPDVKIITPEVFEDNRGFFYESFNHKKFEKIIGSNINFVQDNHSKSTKGVLRGLHYQVQGHSQGKLVRVIQGEVFDVAVDLRKHSPTFKKWVGTILSSENKNQLWVPEGFAHGFLTLSNTAEFIYKTTDYYHKESERGIIWNDNSINIHWPQKENLIISDKDLSAPNLIDAELFK